MGGIVFFRTKMLNVISEFYTKKLGMEVWLEQPDCTIFHHENLLIGFCQRDTMETEGLITFIYNTKEEVDRVANSYQKLTQSWTSI
ncbi:MAG: VOC family protein [Candidatus Thorarchaeota archaeon]|nr:VOC family protein [Candidatus Thorarchaeota archaeon]